MLACLTSDCQFDLFSFPVDGGNAINKILFLKTRAMKKDSATLLSSGPLGNLYRVQGPVSRKSRELFGPEKPFVKLRPAYSVKLVFSYVVKGIKMKITAKFRASRRLRFEDTKRIMSPEIRPKSFGTFEKQAPGFFFASI